MLSLLSTVVRFILLRNALPREGTRTLEHSLTDILTITLRNVLPREGTTNIKAVLLHGKIKSADSGL